MATTTPINGWAVPTSTDLVKDGAVAIETLGDAIDTSVGSGLLAWQTWAPTLSNTWANGNGVWNAKYCQIGKTVHVAASFTLGTTTTKGASLCVVSLPVTAAVTTRPTISSPCAVTVAGASGNLIWTAINSTTTLAMYVFNASVTFLTRNQVSSTVPGTWATNDVMQIAFTYEAA
jgi:hypothetical protein